MNNDDTKNILKKNGFKVTPGRMAVLQLVSKEHVPWDAELLARKIGRKNINEATVYRTLAAFEKSGILKKVDLRRDSVYFEMNDSGERHHHHHIVCTECGGIEDFKICDVEHLVGKIARGSAKFTLKNIKEHSLELFGVCKQCA